ncbi:MAG: bacillithiol biosynthesis cysteine-adding enzyme BshC [Planctomycetota bacterium]|nr:MAG: bacillithiol biosynthesis cysteine-adding enzyme BshC [Planctomycetota bacterium]
MSISLPWSQLPDQSQIYQNYLSDPSWREEYLGYQINSLDDVEKVAKEKRKKNYFRDEISIIIKNYINKLSSSFISPAVKKNIEKIKDPETCFIITGQQPALLGGPLYNFYKAQSIIQIAKELESKTGKPYIPLFWVGSNDHDVAEANRNYYLDKNKRLSKITFNFKDQIPLNLLDVGEGFEKDIASLKNSIGRTDYFDQAINFLEPDKVDHFGTWQSRILLKTFSEDGLLVIEPNELRSVSKNAFKILLENESKIINAIEVQNKKLRKLNLSPQVDNDVTSRFMMFQKSNDRIRLTHKDNKWIANDKSYVIEELIELNFKGELDLTPDALGRPLWQDLLFPAVAYIGGPGEIAYYHQLKKAYECLDLNMPVILPRISATFLENTQLKFLKKNQIEIVNYASLYDWGNVPTSGAYPEQNVSEILKSWSERVKFSAGKDELEKFRKKLLDLNNRFYRTMENIRLKEEGIGNKQLDEFKDFVFPLNGLQERSIGLMQMISKHGESIIDHIKQIEYEFGQHHIIELG